MNSTSKSARDLKDREVEEAINRNRKDAIRHEGFVRPVVRVERDDTLAYDLPERSIRG